MSDTEFCLIWPNFIWKSSSWKPFYQCKPFNEHYPTKIGFNWASDFWEEDWNVTVYRGQWTQSDDST
jgi:hypothetical protein